MSHEFKQDCIFCQIIDGVIPYHKVYEDDDTLAFLDIHPVNSGHVLVIPKKHVPAFHNLEDRDYENLMASVKKVARAVEQSVQPTKVGLLVKGFDVDHAHIHVIPLNTNSDIQIETVELPTNEFTQTATTISKNIPFTNS